MKKNILFVIMLVLFPLYLMADEYAPIHPPTRVEAKDNPYDSGGNILIGWEKSIDDGGHANNIEAYEIFRRENGKKDFVSIGKAASGETKYLDSSAHDATLYTYKVIALSSNDRAESEISSPAKSSQQWFDLNKINVFVISVLLSFFVLYFMARAKKGEKLYVRKIAGLDAIDEAVGRATEMGKPVLFIPGILDLNDIQTLAAITILGRIAKTIAEYDSKLYVPNARAIVMVTAREVVKDAYLEAGRPDAFNPDTINYLTDEQFGYVAGVNGFIVREKPAACLYIGAFFAESLMLAETGYSAGAIQIAGTAAPSQLPFFIAACDYTLIGEELFAASAYLSGDPKLTASLKGQDVGKLIAMGAIVAGSLSVTLAQIINIPFFNSVSNFFIRLFQVV